jgi:hypothetical protein
LIYVLLVQALLFVEEGNEGFDIDGIHFNTLHIAEYYIQENVNGKVDTLYRKYKLTARQAVQEFGEKNVGEKILTAAKEKPDQKFNFIHAVEPTEDYKRAAGKVSLLNYLFILATYAKKIKW